MREQLKATSEAMSQRILARARKPIRKKAIKRVKAKIARQQRRWDDYTEDQREDLVAEEEAIIRSRLREGLPWGALLLLLGLG